MNRIILIGNGFDLAHGLPTRYSDFIEWYWNQWGERLLHAINKCEDDGLCYFQLKDGCGLPYIANAWGHYYQRVNPFVPWDVKDVLSIAKQDTDIFKFEIKGYFFSNICRSVETKGWVDIENEFYDRLSHTDSQAKSLNNDLDVIRRYLIDYLSKIQIGKTTFSINKEIHDLMTVPFVEHDISLDWLNKTKTKIRLAGADYKKLVNTLDRILVLNFNYTDFADRYFSDIRNATIIHIHGSLSNPDSVIFGYGDELDEHYKEILNKNDNEYLRHIKSIRYLESPNYRNLLEFIESSPYQIYIMGHSCGNSDRTLLNTLFEHKNCASIKPFYHKKEDGSDNYIELAQNITRNFTDMKLLRARVVNKDFCEALPQNDQVKFRLQA